MSDVDRHVADKIREISDGVITQNRLAYFIGLTGATLSLKMTGQGKFSLKQVYDIAAVLGVHPFALLPDPEELS